MKNIGILTSSRADFGIYLPLLLKLSNHQDYTVKIIAFGTHLSAFHGYTIKQIEEAGFDVEYKIESMLLTDSPSAVSTSIGLTVIKFADFWKENGHLFDLVFCLGDRYEMFAAVTAGVPFQVPFAHLHGGETTLGAIDNVFRHAITLAAKYHFVSVNEYSKRVADIINTDENIYYTGALSLDNISHIELFTVEEFKNNWRIDLAKKTILITFHPETVAYNNNKQYANELADVINNLPDYQVLITMPNADTAGNIIREVFLSKFSNSNSMYLVENLGTKGYFTAVNYCDFLLGNTSSGIIEAASFGKYVINIGDRQKGRLTGDNVIHTPIIANQILKAVSKIENAKPLTRDNIYFNGGAANKIIEILNQLR